MKAAGEKHGKSKLTARQVREIKRRYIPYAVGMKALAKEYGVAASTIRDIVYGTTWRHIPSAAN